jgi:hypothetical protein
MSNVIEREEVGGYVRFGIDFSLYVAGDLLEVSAETHASFGDFLVDGFLLHSFQRRDYALSGFAWSWNQAFYECKVWFIGKEQQEGIVNLRSC